jgi:hypothetical protein
MKLTRAARRNLRLQTGAFVVLLVAVVGVLGWLSTIYTAEGDWTAGDRNSLSRASRQLLAETEGPVTIEAFASQSDQLRKQIRRFVDRYRRADVGDITFKMVNLDARPERARELGIRRDGQLAVTYQGRTEVADQRTEQAVSRALQRAMRASQRTVRFLAGHGERDPRGRGRAAYGRFSRALSDAGVATETLNLAKTPEIPQDTDAIVVAEPQKPLLDAEVAALRDYLANGGRLLWLADKQPNASLKPLAGTLGISFREGTAVDPQTRVFGIADPTQVLVAEYPDHAITEDFGAITLYPGAGGLTAGEDGAWDTTALLKTGKSAWLERGQLAGEVSYDETEDGDGPVTLGMALTRATGGESEGGGKSDAGDAGRRARAVVLADGDVLANAHIRNGGNRQLGLNIVNWLTADEDLIQVQPAQAPGTSLDLPTVVAWAMPIVFLGVIPGGMLLAGGAIWLHRRRL